MAKPISPNTKMANVEGSGTWLITTLGELERIETLTLSGLFISMKYRAKCQSVKFLNCSIDWAIFAVFKAVPLSSIY
jgi:hypothetical protein